MSIKFLRWQSGATGDTVLKILLDSNPDLHSQVAYTEKVSFKTKNNLKYVNNFPFDQLSLLTHGNKKDREINQLLDQNKLFDQLSFLKKQSNKKWLFKTHYYFDYQDYTIIDITIPLAYIPFSVKASLVKIPRTEGKIYYNNPIIHRINDGSILYYFDCYNFIQDRLKPKNLSSIQLSLSDILKGWNNFKESLKKLEFSVSDNCKSYYDAWLKLNQEFMPSKEYLLMIKNKKYDFNNTNLSLEERYCLLVLSGQKFKILKK